MKNFSSLLYSLFLCLLISASLFAQTNAVVLKDGSGASIGNFNSITTAYAAIPATLTQAYIIELTAAYDGSVEVYPIIFVAKAGAGVNNTITLRPEIGVSSVAISSTQSTLPLLRLDDADYIIIDGRPGGTGTMRALMINNQGTGTTSYGILFINGAGNNIVRHCRFSGYTTTGTGGKAIYIGASSTNPDGNSNNRFEFLTFDNGPRYYMNSSGTPANPNRNLYVYGCEFLNINFCGWWQQNGTGKVNVDSCMFYSTGAGIGGSTGTGVFPILSDFQLDTLIITRNKIFNIDNFSYSTDVIGIALRSFNPGSVVRIYNNFISLTAPNSSCDETFGIEFGTNSANNPFDANVFHNTVVVGGTALAGTAGNINSAAFSVSESNTLSKLDVRNNIFINQRQGGLEEHQSVSRISTLGTSIFDYNTYASAATSFAQIGTTVYPDFISYQTASSPSDINSNNVPVQFVSATDLHLSGPSIGDANLYGIAVPEVTDDIDGELRVHAYRGADEADESTSINNLFKNSDVIIYPSPANQFVAISNHKSFLSKIEIINSSGELVYKENGIVKYTTDINTSTFSEGIYLVRITTVADVINKRLIIVR
jgi:hypothetical protein